MSQSLNEWKMSQVNIKSQQNEAKDNARGNQTQEKKSSVLQFQIANKHNLNSNKENNSSVWKQK